jgi:uncharacterized protein YndB with AHSA1/START domain
MKTVYTIGEDQKTLLAERSIEAPLEKVWAAWTNSEELDKWWAPLPYQAITKSYSFTEGGEWHYCMRGPEGDVHWCLNTYLIITPFASFTAVDCFCDEKKVVNEAMPSNHWDIQFDTEGNLTKILVTTTYATPKDLQTVINMGMKEGFNMGLDQLEALLAT